ncbi:hypothetical protein P7K49_002069 [Saguinus oedipus]|uniref:Uncharacterized protein n=1 Tax=Saguinus oedipus TaxID=9490 RepID=A0ABQ9WIW8_SAGOE|nr:hypothetical protein P7K49_002069 [Saguinus oedipus]
MDTVGSGQTSGSPQSWRVPAGGSTCCGLGKAHMGCLESDRPLLGSDTLLLPTRTSFCFHIGCCCAGAALLSQRPSSGRLAPEDGTIHEEEKWGEASNDEGDPKDKTLPEDPETCLQLNMVYQEVIQEKLADANLLLAQNREQQEELMRDLAGSKGTKVKDGKNLPPSTYMGHFMKPYFKDKVTGVGPPANEDTREKAAQGIKAFEELLVTKCKSPSWPRGTPELGDSSSQPCLLWFLPKMSDLSASPGDRALSWHQALGGAVSARWRGCICGPGVLFTRCGHPPPPWEVNADLWAGPWRGPRSSVIALWLLLREELGKGLAPKVSGE